jgi:NAD(P)-dependent dehydrogenase (short-subunit alcohol dehydrogenase family)
MIEGRVAVITGAGSGIGRASALRFARAGAKVCLVDRDLGAVEETARRVVVGGGQAVAIGADVADAQAMTEMVWSATDTFQRIDILLHSAGVGVERPFLETSEVEWRRILDIDLTGTFNCCQAVAISMASAGYGRIVTIASTAGIRGGTGRAAYGAAKAGVIGLSRVMAVELAPLGIAVNCLAPGAIETEMVASMHSQETRAVYRRGIPMDRYGTPEEVAETALFLASDAAGYVTGQVLGVDGGFLAAGVMYEQHAERLVQERTQ